MSEPTSEFDPMAVLDPITVAILTLRRSAFEIERRFAIDGSSTKVGVAHMSEPTSQLDPVAVLGTKTVAVLTLRQTEFALRKFSRMLREAFEPSGTHPEDRATAES